MVIATASRTYPKTLTVCKFGAQVLWSSSKKAFMHQGKPEQLCSNVIHFNLSPALHYRQNMMGM